MEADNSKWYSSTNDNIDSFRVYSTQFDEVINHQQYQLKLIEFLLKRRLRFFIGIYRTLY